MINLRTFQMTPDGAEIQEHDNFTRVQIKPRGKELISAGIASLVLTIFLGTLFLFRININDDKGALLFFISFVILFLFIDFFIIIMGINASHAKINIDIDPNKNITIHIEKPIRPVKPITFQSDKNIRVYQTMTQSSRSGKSYSLHISSDDDKKFTFSMITELQMIWLLYTICELFNQQPEPLGPLNIVSEFVNHYNSIPPNEPVTGSQLQANNLSAQEYY